jgi:hypothetical protein
MTQGNVKIMELVMAALGKIRIKDDQNGTNSYNLNSLYEYR